jgi:uncharacterized protein YdhG (YjbR/CyaY superfamily)
VNTGTAPGYVAETRNLGPSGPGRRGRRRGGILNAPLIGSNFVTPQRLSSPKTVDEYLARVPPRFRTALQQLRRTIKAAAPEAVEVMSYQMPAFRQNGMLVYYAAYKDHCSFFVGSYRVRRKFAAELKPFEAGKGTLHFTPDHPMPSNLVSRIVKARVAENAARHPG